MNEKEFNERVSDLVRTGVSKEKAEREIALAIRNRRIAKSTFYASRYKRLPKRT